MIGLPDGHSMVLAGHMVISGRLFFSQSRVPAPAGLDAARRVRQDAEERGHGQHEGEEPHEGAVEELRCGELRLIG